MAESNSIERKPSIPDAHGFDRMQQEGIKLVQDLAGDLWTDYNPHDPGVTILEQLCYALTDLIYRTEFDTADYLTGKSGSIDFGAQALYLPQDIFPSQPITINDYRKIFADQMVEIDNVWVRTVEDGQVKGLYRIDVTLVGASLQGAGSDQMPGRVLDIYAANRNLCEDLDGVNIVEPRFYTLRGKLALKGNRDPVSMLAELYFKCAKRIAPGIHFRPFRDLLKAGKSFEEVFRGPLTQRGYIQVDDLDQRSSSVTLSDVIAMISDIDGVEYDSLWFEDTDGNRAESIDYDASLQSIPSLRFPDREEDAITLWKGGREYRVLLQEVRMEYDRLNAESRAERHTGQDFEEVYTPPEGAFREDLGEYYSVQNHFPAVYGINQYGVPNSAPDRRKSQAKQLKAYLMFFDQIMANFLATVRELPRLFSPDEQLAQSYFHQVIRNQNAPNVEVLYQGTLDQVDAEIAWIVSRYDQFSDRRSRILDYLLGIYSETFTHNSLRHFNDYYTPEELRDKIIQNKSFFLRHLVEISQKRAAAFDYREASWNTENVSGLQKKVSMLLDLTDWQSRSLPGVLLEHELELVSDEQYSRLGEDNTELAFVDLGDMEADQQFGSVAEEGLGERDEGRLFEEIVFLRHRIISASILRSGIDLARYRLGRAGEGNAFQIRLQVDEDSQWCVLGAYGTLQQAVEAANDLRRFLLRLNVESEGFHMVEHILLRPQDQASHTKSVPDDFYSFQLSVILPNWTARFNNEGFRRLAAETVQLNCPAHILPRLYWVDFGLMREFETDYQTWLNVRRDQSAGVEDVNAAAEQLITVLLEMERAENEDG